jgi:hypothetical protein
LPPGFSALDWTQLYQFGKEQRRHGYYLRRQREPVARISGCRNVLLARLGLPGVQSRARWLQLRQLLLPMFLLRRWILLIQR